MANDPAAPAAPAPGSDPAPAPSGANPPADAKTLLTQGDPPADPAKPPADPAKPADPVIPEKYEFKAPEGVTLDAGLVDAITPVLKDLKLTQEQASKLVDTYNEYGKKFTAEAEKKADADFKQWMADQATANTKAVQKEWGADFNANLATAQRGLARVLSPEGKRLLDETGLGNHPEFLKAFLAVGKMIREDTPPNGASPSGRKSSADVLYPSTAAAH